jgi:hypothetical protein
MFENGAVEIRLKVNFSSDTVLKHDQNHETPEGLDCLSSHTRA